jgi:hypothetical protein
MTFIARTRWHSSNLKTQNIMPSLTNKRQVKAFALAHSPKGKTRVSQTFLDGIETATRLAILKQLNHHDNKISKGKTLV